MRERRLISRATFLLCALFLLSELLLWQVLPVCHASGYEDDCRALDLYTNKEPFSGKGADQESDAFEPQEEAVLYGLVTYNSDPVPGKIVSFNVRGPANSIDNITMSLSGVTDDDGLARVSFTMPWPVPRPEATIFGVWNVVASVDIAGVVVTDTLSFKVGWVIKLLYVKTADVDKSPKSTFSRAERMGFRLGVENIALRQKTVTFVVDAYDELNVWVGELRLESEVVQPGEKEYFVKEMSIPPSASAGQGRAVANALKTVLGNVSVAWCLHVETAFWISTAAVLHDVAVLSVAPSASEGFSNETVNIAVVVKNNGLMDESFNVRTCYDSALIGTQWVVSLAVGAERTLTFAWPLEGVQAGEYRIKAEAGPVIGETFLDNNVFIDGVVKVKSSAITPPPGPGALDIRWLLASMFILIVLVAAVLVMAVILLLVCRRRRKTDEEEPKVVTEEVAVLPLHAVKECSVCGKEFSTVYTFCPHCMSFHGKDF